MSTTSTSESPWYPPFAAAAPGGVFPTPTTAVETPLVTEGLAELWRVPYEGCERLIASRSRLIALGSAGARAWSSSGDSGTALPVVGSHAVLDQAGTHLVGVDDEGMPLVVPLDDPTKAARVALHYSGARDIQAIERCGDVLVFVTTTRPGWHGERPFSLIEFVQLVDTDDIDECLYVEGVEDLGAMMCDDVDAPLIAAEGNTVVAGTNTGITRFALDGSVCSFHPLTSRPLGLAVGPSGDWTALVRGADGLELQWWTAEGGDPSVVALPVDAWPPGRAPLFSGTGLVFLTPPGEVLGCSPEGVVFRFRRVGASPGVATGSGTLLVEHQKGLWRCDTTGTAEPVWIGDGTVCTPTVAGGRVFLATRSEIIALGCCRSSVSA